MAGGRRAAVVRRHPTSSRPGTARSAEHDCAPKGRSARATACGGRRAAREGTGSRGPAGSAHAVVVVVARGTARGRAARAAGPRRGRWPSTLRLTRPAAAPRPRPRRGRRRRRRRRRRGRPAAAPASRADARRLARREEVVTTDPSLPIFRSSASSERRAVTTGGGGGVEGGGGVVVGAGSGVRVAARARPRLGSDRRLAASSCGAKRAAALRPREARLGSRRGCRVASSCWGLLLHCLSFGPEEPATAAPGRRGGACRRRRHHPRPINQTRRPPSRPTTRGCGRRSASPRRASSGATLFGRASAARARRSCSCFCAACSFRGM